MHPPALCFSAPISVKVTSSGDEGWECEEGDCVWYPLEGLPGLGLELPEEPAYRMTPPPADKGRTGHEISELRVVQVQAHNSSIYSDINKKWQYCSLCHTVSCYKWCHNFKLAIHISLLLLYYFGCDVMLHDLWPAALRMCSVVASSYA